MRRAAYVCRDGKIGFEDLALGRDTPWLQKIADSLAQAEAYDKLHEVVDRVVLPTVLHECGSISATAKRLRIGRDRMRAHTRALGLYDVGED